MLTPHMLARPLVQSKLDILASAGLTQDEFSPEITKFEVLMLWIYNTSFYIFHLKFYHVYFSILNHAFLTSNWVCFSVKFIIWELKSYNKLSLFLSVTGFFRIPGKNKYWIFSTN